MAGDPQPKPEPRKANGRRRPLPAVSTRRAGQRDAAWWAGQVATQGYRARCAARGLLRHECSDDRGVDPHHVTPRSVRPDLAATVANIIPLCRTAHRIVDSHPALAHDLGLHRYASETPMPRPASLIATLPASRGSVEQPADTWEAVLDAYVCLAGYLPHDVEWSYRTPPEPIAPATGDLTDLDPTDTLEPTP